MDRRHRELVVYREPDELSYPPAGLTGDVEDLQVDAADPSRPFQGKASVRITYRPRKARKGWAGVYFQYPEQNWGSCAGRDLRGATKLTFWARADRPTKSEFKSGGTNRNLHHDPALPFMDSYGPLSTGKVSLTPEWQLFTIDLRTSDLTSVLGPLVWVSNLEDGFDERSVFLDEIVIDKSTIDKPRFLQSYFSGGDIAHVYDEALVALAYLARGETEDLRRARLIADAFVEVQKKDRAFHDGRLRNAYRAGELLDPCNGKPRIPGFWKSAEGKFFEDQYAVGSDTGNLAWAGLALVQAHAILEGPSPGRYLAPALAIGRWIVENHRVEDAFGGFSGGFEGFDEHPRKRTYRSTEHNIDLSAFFRHLARAVGDGTPEGRKWADQARHAERLIEAMWNESTGQRLHLWTGTHPDGMVVNRDAIPLDVQTWSVLALEPRNHEPALNWALANCGAREIPAAFDFNCGDGDGAWWEGTGQVAAALSRLGRAEQAGPILAELRRAQLEQGSAAGALPAASKKDLTTGFGWTYPNDPHIGATAWYIFAELGKNPYDLVGGLRP